MDALGSGDRRLVYVCVCVSSVADYRRIARIIGMYGRFVVDSQINREQCVVK